jgi:4-alpha-glucanotransferase
MKTKRSSGILCHISSLPSPYGIGDLGPGACAFVDFLSRSGQAWWQVLPLNPTDNALGNSPYSSFSAFAFNVLLISPQLLVSDGFLLPQDVPALESLDEDRAAFDRVYAHKTACIDAAYRRYEQRRFPLKDFESFVRHQSGWLDDFALFVVLKNHFNNESWVNWPEALRDRHPDALQVFARDYSAGISKVKFAQYLFYSQWMRLQAYCSAKGVGLIGDIPIYVNYDSVDVWVDPHLFKLDAQKKPVVVAGVPPDYFSAQGQRWGNPVYDWAALQASDFAWWVKRMAHNLALFDAVRVDHFRAFAQCWEIPAEEATAVRGAWRDVPGAALFTVLRGVFPHLPVIAEDLGIITPDVDALKEQFGFPGMRVVMFAFHNDYKKSRDLPENYVPHSVVYTGTHDNNTIRGWFDNDLSPMEKKNMIEYFGVEPAAADIHWRMMALAVNSVSGLCIIPVQDLLGLGAGARMNRPSTVEGNWQWRFRSGDFSPQAAARLLLLTQQGMRVG